MHGLAELASETFKMHTRIGYPMGVSGLIDVIHDPSYATGVGTGAVRFPDPAEGPAQARTLGHGIAAGSYGRSSGGGGFMGNA